MSFKSLLLSFALAATGCHLGDTSAANPMAGLVLRTYDVPAGQAQRLRAALKEVLWFGSDGKDSNKWVGRVDVGPDGRLIVLASEPVHEGVKALVASVAANPAYALAALTIAIYANAIKQGPGMAKTSGKLVTVAVTLQVFLGIVTLVYRAPLALSAMHQLLAALLFCIAVWHAHELRRPADAS